LRDGEKRIIKNRYPDAKKDELGQMDFTKHKAWWMEMAILKFPRGYCWVYTK
jgi:hypothetical protein